MATKRTQNVTDLPQYYGETITEGVANTGIISQVPTSLTTRDRTGILIHALEVLPTANLTGGDYFAASADGYMYGLTQLYNAGTVPAFNDPGILCYFLQFANFTQKDEVYSRPHTHVFETPLLAHPAALFMFLKGMNQPAVVIAQFRLTYSYTGLTDQLYQDLIQTIVLQNQL